MESLVALRFEVLDNIVPFPQIGRPFSEWFVINPQQHVGYLYKLYDLPNGTYE